MQNDDLGQFPKPQTSTDTSSTVPVIDGNTPSLPDFNLESTPISYADDTPPTVSNTSSDNTTPMAPSFEETPAEIPSIYTQTNPQPEPLPVSPFETTPPPVMSDTFTNISSPFVPKSEPEVASPATSATPEPVPATLPPQTGVNMKSVIFAFVFILAVISVAGAAFLFQRTVSLQQQLKDLTQTINNREVNPTITPTPSVIEFPTPTFIPLATPSATPTTTPSATPTLSVYEPGSPLRPLSIVNKVMQIAIKHQPNAQLILLKTENAHDPLRTSTKYFFRQDLNTKKYFYILVSGKNEPQIFDKNIFVTPDNNIPSLNDLVLKNNLGIDLDEALSLAVNSCVNTTICSTAPVSAQFIQTSTNVIWQLSLNLGTQKEPAVIQIDSQTKVILFKTADFVSK